ncbi:MAG: hypothetical protein C0504_12580 [Candidatus Solibacter sp.]|nr:hypothetical protein [Candidatus Solibacter sp.]
MPSSLIAQSASQSKPYRYSGNGYAFGAIGACQHGYPLFGGGGGGEALLWKGLTVGAEGGAYTFSDGYSFGSIQPTIGWHFVDRNRRATNEGFVNFGPGIAFGAARGGTSPWASIGGGMIGWINDRVGLRVEGRIQAFRNEGMVIGRIGVSFR